MSPDRPPPPTVGELLPRGAQAVGVRYKLATYSLDLAHKYGGPKARGFELILGITIDAIDTSKPRSWPASSTHPSATSETTSPTASNYVVNIQVRGIGAKGGRVINVRTV
jgi:hypothetical protein